MLATLFSSIVGKDASEEAIARMLDEAAARWPGVVLSPEVFFRFLAEHPGELAHLHTADMFLVAACLAGSQRALAIFDEEFLRATIPALRRLKLAPEAVEEARQVLRHRFFVSLDGPAKAASYAGTGPLRAWVRAALVRAALRVLRQPTGRVDEVALLALASPRADLELDYLKRTYGPPAEEAVRQGFAALEPRERNLLRQHFGHGLGIDELARGHGVHRATAARWLVKARTTLAERTRELLVARLQVANDEVASILRLLQSHLEDAMRDIFTRSSKSTP